MIVIPDVHGRKMWKDACSKAKENETIVFLGDYLDPYPDESPMTKVPELQVQAIDNFKEIIKYKRGHKKVILLVGNHDLGYFISTNICSCRSDRAHYETIQNLFRENKGLFQLCYKAEINGKTFIFSHAGIRNEWLERFKDNNDIDTCDWLNNQFDLTTNSDYPSETTFAGALGIYSKWRGWSSERFASPVWSDVREWLSNYEQDLENYKEIHIFGHTRCNSIVYGETFAMLDDGSKPRGFRLDLDGKLKELNGDEISQNVQDFL